MTWSTRHRLLLSAVFSYSLLVSCSSFSPERFEARALCRALKSNSEAISQNENQERQTITQVQQWAGQLGLFGFVTTSTAQAAQVARQYASQMSALQGRWSEIHRRLHDVSARSAPSQVRISEVVKPIQSHETVAIRLGLTSTKWPMNAGTPEEDLDRFRPRY